MAVHAPTTAEVIRARKVDVVRMLGIGNLEVVAERVEPFQRNPFPAAADVSLEVVDGAGVGRRAMWIPKKRSVTTRVVVVNAANIEPEIAEGFLPAAVEVHFDVAAWVTRALTYVR